MSEAMRFQWEEGRRTLEALGSEAARPRQLAALVEAVTAELRRRLGQSFTLAELYELSVHAEDWVREIVAAAVPARARVGIRDTALVQDAAFASFARGAADYRP